MELDIWIVYLDGGWLLSDTWSRFGNVVHIKFVYQLRQHYMEWELAIYLENEISRMVLLLVSAKLLLIASKMEHDLFSYFHQLLLYTLKILISLNLSVDATFKHV